MLSALASGHKVGIAVVAGVFIAFALVSSFVLPALRPQFPGRRVGLFVAFTVLLTAGMLGTVIALAGEPKEAREAAPATTTTAPTPSPAPSPAAGDPAAGKALFSAQGCNACHTFKPAGATAKVGPDLDNLAADAAKANRGPVEKYAAESITDPGAYVVPGYPNGVMPTTFKSLSAKQIADLVAFLGSGSSWDKGNQHHPSPRPTRWARHTTAPKPDAIPRKVIASAEGAGGLFGVRGGEGGI